MPASEQVQNLSRHYDDDGAALDDDGDGGDGDDADDTLVSDVGDHDDDINGRNHLRELTLPISNRTTASVTSNIIDETRIQRHLDGSPPQISSESGSFRIRGTE